MAGPWEKYQRQSAPEAVPPPSSAAGPAATGPWTKYQQAQEPVPEGGGGAEPSFWDRALNETFWGGVAKAGWDAFTLPHDVMKGEVSLRVDPDAGSQGDEIIRRSTNLAAFASPASRALRVAAPSAGRAIAGAFERSGVDPSLPAVSQNRGISGLATGIGESIAGGPITRGTQRQMEQVAARTDELAGRLSPVSERATAGERLQQGVGRFVEDGIPAQQKAMYDDARGLIGDSTISPLPRSQAEVRRIAAMIRNSKVRDFSTDPNFKELTEVLKAVGPEGLSFNDLRQLRTTVRGLRPAEGSATGINKVATERVYRALTEDMLDLARQAGGEEAVKAVRRADQLTRAFEVARKPELLKILKAESGEKVFDEVIRLASEKGGADWRRLAAVRKSAGPDAWNDMAAAALRNMGRPTPGAKGSVDAPDFSPATFMTNWNKLSDRGKSILFGQTDSGDLRSALDDLAKVVGEMKRVERLGNPSGTWRGIVGGATGAGLYVDPLSTLGTLAGANVAARAMMSPRVVRWLTGVAKIQEAGARRGPEATRATLEAHARHLPRITDAKTGEVLRRIVTGAGTGSGDTASPPPLALSRPQ